MTTQNGIKWEDDSENCVVKIPIEEGVGKKQLSIVWTPTTLKTSVKGETKLDGTLEHSIYPDESTWYISTEEDGSRFLILEIAKQNDKDPWAVLLKGDVAEAKAPDPNAMGGMGGMPGMPGMGGGGGGQPDMAAMMEMMKGMQGGGGMGGGMPDFSSSGVVEEDDDDMPPLEEDDGMPPLEDAE